jgi:hypothetical protein
MPIVEGGKKTGRQSRFNIGFMDVLTGKAEGSNLGRQNTPAARVICDFWKQSYVGGIFMLGNRQALEKTR